MNYKKKVLRLLSSISLLVSAMAILYGVAMAGEPGRTLLAADLKQEPFIDAAKVSALAANTELDVVKRQGGWLQVKTAAGEQGWLKMTSVKLGSATASADSKGDSGVGSLAKMALTGRSGNTGVTATTGVRGLGQEDLKNAHPNPEAVKQLDNYLGSRNETQSFASSGKLQAQSINYLNAGR